MFQTHNPYQSSLSAFTQSESTTSAEPEKYLLLAVGIVMGVELVGIPALIVLVLAVGLDFATHPFWIVFTVLTVTAILAGLIFAKLLRLAKPTIDDSRELDGRDLFGEPVSSASHRR